MSQDEKESKNHTTKTATTNSTSHTRGSRTDDHYFAAANNGSVTLNSDVWINSGKATVSPTDRHGSDVLVMPNGHVIDRKTGLLSETLTGNIGAENAKDLLHALKSAQRSGGISTKEEIALNNVREKIDTWLEIGEGKNKKMFDDIKAAIKDVEKVANGADTHETPQVAKTKAPSHGRS